MTFKDAMKADLPVFTNPEEFGNTVLFSRTGEYIDVILDKDMEPETGRYVDFVTAVVSDVADVETGDTFTTETGKVYHVTASAPVILNDEMVMIRVDA